MRLWISAVVLLLAVLIWSCAADAEPWRDKIKITNDRREIVGYIYKPCSTCRTQILDDRRRVRGYIDSRGQVTNTRRQRVLDIDLLPEREE